MEDIESAPLLSGKQNRGGYKKKYRYLVGTIVLLVLVATCINFLTTTNGGTYITSSRIHF
jgi:hypothetical protein